MISTESFIKVKEDIRIQRWNNGSSITLKYKLFYTQNNKLFLCIEKKTNSQQKQIEKLNWFKSHPICELQIDEIGYYGYILSEQGYLFRIPLGIFGIQDAKEEWNKQVTQNEEEILLNYKQTWELTSKLKEVIIININELILNNIINPLTKKPSTIEQYMLSQFLYLTLWRANDNKQYVIIASKGGVIIFVSLETFQIVLSLNLEVNEIRKIKLIETQSLSYLLVQYSFQDEYLQIQLQKNQKQDDKDGNTNQKRSKSSINQKNLLNSFKDQQFLSEMATVVNNSEFQYFVSEESGAIRIFFYSNKQKILKVYRPGNLSSSKYRFFISLSEVIDIIQWKNYYLVFQKENNLIKVDFFLKVTLQKCDKNIIETPSFKPKFPKPVFSYNLYDSNIEIIKVDQFIQLSDRTFSVDIYKSNGIDTVFLDVNHGKLELENQIHSDNFQIQTYIYYELFLRNHSYEIDYCISHLYQSLKSQQKWENLCLIDLQNKNKDPFKLFHEYSNIKSPKMENNSSNLFYLPFFQIIQKEYLLFKSLLNAFEKVEVLDERVFNGFAINILFGAFGVKINSFNVEDCPQFKYMQTILKEQSLSVLKLISHLQEQKEFSSLTKNFKNYLSELSKEEEQVNVRYSKKFADFNELNLIFRQKRYAELVLNIISIVSSVPMLHQQRDRLELSELLQVIMIDEYWINEQYLMYTFKQSYEQQKTPNFTRCIFLIILYHHKEGFHQELSFYLQKLNLEELFKLLNIIIRNLKVMYQNKPFINQNCIYLLFTKFYSLQLNEHAIKEFITKSLVQSTADRNFKDVCHNDFSTYQTLLSKIVKQKQKLAQGTYQKFLIGIDAVWLILKQLQKQISKQSSSKNVSEFNQETKSKLLIANNIQRSSVSPFRNKFLKPNDIKRSSLSPKKNKIIKQVENNNSKDKQLEFILINNFRLSIQTPNKTKSIYNQPHFIFKKKDTILNDYNQDQEKENSFRQKSESVHESVGVLASIVKNNNSKIINSNEQNKIDINLSSLLTQVEDLIQQIQKITSNKVKKIISPNQQICSLLMNLK